MTLAPPPLMLPPPLPSERRSRFPMLALGFALGVAATLLAPLLLSAWQPLPPDPTAPEVVAAADELITRRLGQVVTVTPARTIQRDSSHVYAIGEMTVQSPTELHAIRYSVTWTDRATGVFSVRLIQVE